MTSAKIIGSEMDEAGFEGSVGSMEADNGDYGRDKHYLTIAEGVGTIEVQQKGKKFYGKKADVEDSGNNHLDDIKEACSGTEEGHKLSGVRARLETDVVDAKIARSSSQGTRKRSKKVLFGGGLCALNFCCLAVFP